MNKLETGSIPRSTLLTVEDVAEYWWFQGAEVISWLERQRAGGLPHLGHFGGFAQL
jgi:hypothetical protein